jgi:hypothetical protein
MADEGTPKNGSPDSSEDKQSSGLSGGLGDLVKAESMIQLAIALPAGCLIGWLLGHWADGHFHQSWIGITGIILGAIGGFIQIFTTASRFLKKG